MHYVRPEVFKLTPFQKIIIQWTLGNLPSLTLQIEIESPKIYLKLLLALIHGHSRAAVGNTLWGTHL